MLAIKMLPILEEGKESYNSKNTMPIVKHSSKLIMLRGYFSMSGSGALVWVERIMKKKNMRRIWKKSEEVSSKTYFGSEFSVPA